mgnify:CR=1 FL=1
MSRLAPVSVLVVLLAGLVAPPLGAQPWAFVSVSEPGNRAVRVVNLDTMTVEASISGLGDEPGRMVANADRTRIYLSSATTSGGVAGQVHVIDTRTRQRIASVAVGNAQNRTIALSPDGQRVYTFKREGSGPSLSKGVIVLDAVTLAEIATVPLVGSGCAANAGQVLAMPDGRIVASGCSDGLRVIDPVSFAVSFGGTTPTAEAPLLGVSPDGSEVYVPQPVPGGPGVFGATGVRAIHPSTGASTVLTWNVPQAGSYPGFGSSVLSRVAVVGSGPDAVYYFCYLDPGFSNAAIGWATPASLGARQLIGLAAVGSTAVIGADPSGQIGLSGRLGSIRRLAFGTPSGLTPPPVSATSSFLSLPGVGTLSDIIVVPYPQEVVFVDGFEGDGGD